MTYILIIIVSYLIGSIPFAYIFIRIYTKGDIRKLGSGNVGARNSYEITGKKWLGNTVFFLDVLKGFLAVLIARLFTNNDFISISLASVFVVLGHNYPVFLKFRGGRGLASALGSMLLINPMMIFLWIIMWLVGFYIIKRDILAANITATLMVPIVYFILPESVIKIFSFVDYQSVINIKLLTLLICAIIILRHIGPMKELMKKTKTTGT